MASGNFKLSVLLEAITAAFNTNVKGAADTFAKAEKDMQAAATSASTATTAATDAQQKAVTSAASAATAGAQAQAEAARTVTTAVNAEAAAAKTAATAIKAAGDATVQATSNTKGAADGVNRLTSSLAGEATAARGAASALGGATQATTAAGKAATDAAKATADATKAVKPPTLFGEFFIGLKKGWQEGGQAARAAADATGAAANGAGARVKGLKDEVNGLGPAAKKSGKEAEDGLSLGGLVKSVAAVVGLKEAIQALGENAIVVQQVTKQLEFATGGIAQANAAYALIKQTSNELGISLEAAAKGFAQLASSTKGTALEGEATRQLFIGISQAAAVLNLSTAETGGVINALSQIASKGTVQLEELRGQLGERLPGVLKIAADAMGVTVTELNTLVSSGLDANIFLAKFGPALQNAFSAKAAENLNTLGGQLNLLKNGFFELLETINNAGAANAFTTIVRDLVAGLETIKQAFKQAGTSPELQEIQKAFETGYAEIKVIISNLVASFGEIYGAVDQATRQVTELFQVFIPGADGSTESLTLLQTALLGVNISIAAISDAVKEFGIGLSVVSGSSQLFFASIATAGAKIVGLFNKDLAQALTDYADKLFAAADKSLADADRKAQGFKSSIVAVLDGVSNSAQKAAADAQAAGEKSLLAAKQGMEALTAAVAAGKEPAIALQAQADEVSIAYKKLGETGVLSAKQVATALNDVAKTLGTSFKLGIQDALSQFAQLGEAGVRNIAGVSEGTAKAVVALAALRDNAKLTKDVFKQELAQLVDGAKTAGDIKVIEDALVALAARGKLTQGAIDELFNQIRDKSIQIGPAIEKSFADSLDRVGVKTKEALGGAVLQAQNDLGRIQQLASEGKVGYDAVTAAQQKLAEAQAAATPGAITLADVNRHLAEINAQVAVSTEDCTRKLLTFNEAVAKSNVESAKITSAGAGLNTVFASLRDQLLGLSAAAANQFGTQIGVQFGFIEAGAEASQAAINGLRAELDGLRAFNASPDFIGISTKMQQLAVAAAQTKLEFAQQKQAVDDSTQRILNLANSGTASLADLQKATKLSGQSFGILGKSDLTGLNSALDAAKNRITAIENASKSAAQALKSLGDSFQVDLLRSQGKNVEAIQIEAQQQAQQIDDQIAALGKNASPEALAAANRAKGLLAQVTAQKIAEQKAADAKAKAAGTTPSADATPDIRVPATATPPQAVSPTAPTPTPTATANNAATGAAGAPAGSITLKFLAADGKQTTLIAPTQKAADDLLSILTRSGATNITKQGSGG